MKEGVVENKKFLLDCLTFHSLNMQNVSSEGVYVCFLFFKNHRYFVYSLQLPWFREYILKPPSSHLTLYGHPVYLLLQNIWKYIFQSSHLCPVSICSSWYPWYKSRKRPLCPLISPSFSKRISLNPYHPLLLLQTINLFIFWVKPIIKHICC